MQKGFVSSLYPTTKGVFILTSILSSFFLDWKFAYFIILPLCFILALVDGKLLSYLKKIAISLVSLILFIFLFKIILDQTSQPVLWDAGFFKITEKAVLDGLNQSSLIVVLVSTILLFFETTDMEELMLALQKLNMSHMVSYIFLSTMQLIPDMTKKSKVIMQAQQARGIETEGSLMRRIKAFFPSLGPLIISSIADVEDRAVTLEVRGFSSSKKKTALKVMKKKPLDKVIESILVVATVGIIVWRVVG